MQKRLEFFVFKQTLDKHFCLGLIPDLVNLKLYSYVGDEECVSLSNTKGWA